jgi:hypothetical protein
MTVAQFSASYLGNSNSSFLNESAKLRQAPRLATNSVTHWNFSTLLIHALRNPVTMRYSFILTWRITMLRGNFFQLYARISQLAFSFPLGERN